MMARVAAELGEQLLGRAVAGAMDRQVREDRPIGQDAGDLGQPPSPEPCAGPSTVQICGARARAQRPMLILERAPHRVHDGQDFCQELTNVWVSKEDTTQVQRYVASPAERLDVEPSRAVGPSHAWAGSLHACCGGTLDINDEAVVS